MEPMGRTPTAVVAEALPTTCRRETRGGRTLEYALKVIQQPERARACGSGAKSSADRRPVDPPPVVELRIYDLNGNGPNGKEDVTFSYEANFFLFATLEVARAMAHHRGQPPPSQQVPVLTGMPVSGMAYLDRPVEAGYFIFPDLSVRHEGRYRLSFNLYEETKKLDDTDKDVSMDGKKAMGGASPDASFDWRMEVKSDAFTVYSAKKFPGLAESTNLSRTVAEQGCRVRIRRDVRMRRRDGKGNGEYDEVPEDDSRGRVPEQEPFIRERSRSNSAGSDDGRSVHQDSNQHSGYPSPVGPHVQPPLTGFLNFGEQNGHPHQSSVFAPPPPPQQQAAPPSYQYQQPAYAPTGVLIPPPPPSTYRSQQAAPLSAHYQHPHSAHPSHPPREPREIFEPDRRASFPATYSHPAQQAPYYATPDHHYGQHQSHSFAPRQNEMPIQPVLPPLKIASAESRNESLHSPPGPLSSLRSIASLSSPLYERGQEHGSFHPHYMAPQPLQEPLRNGSKRSHGFAFNTSSNIEPLSNGMRPSSPHESGDGDEDIMRALGKMEYKRADGTHISILAPGLVSHGQ